MGDQFSLFEEQMVIFDKPSAERPRNSLEAFSDDMIALGRVVQRYWTCGHPEDPDAAMEAVVFGVGTAGMDTDPLVNIWYRFRIAAHEAAGGGLGSMARGFYAPRESYNDGQFMRRHLKSIRLDHRLQHAARYFEDEPDLGSLLRTMGVDERRSIVADLNGVGFKLASMMATIMGNTQLMTIDKNVASVMNQWGFPVDERYFNSNGGKNGGNYNNIGEGLYHDLEGLTEEFCAGDQRLLTPKGTLDKHLITCLAFAYGRDADLFEGSLRERVTQRWNVPWGPHGRPAPAYERNHFDRIDYPDTQERRAERDSTPLLETA